MGTVHVSGRDGGRIVFYALSTCAWCQKTKKLLNDLGVEYDYVDMDLLKGEERDEALETVRRWNRDCSFPTLVINDNKCIVGFREKEIRDALRP